MAQVENNDKYENTTSLTDEYKLTIDKMLAEEENGRLYMFLLKH
jgi:hypothetical protein